MVILSEELARRKSRNPRYSLRAFAHFLGLDPSALSRILAGKQHLSLKMTQRVLQALHLTEKQKVLFTESVAEQHQARTVAFLSFDAKGLSAPRSVGTLRPGFNGKSADIQVKTYRIRIPAHKVDEAQELIQTFVSSMESILTQDGSNSTLPFELCFSASRESTNHLNLVNEFPVNELEGAGEKNFA